MVEHTGHNEDPDVPESPALRPTWHAVAVGVAIAALVAAVIGYFLK